MSEKIPQTRFPEKESSGKVCAVILSAGKGTRMNSDVPKQLLKIDGVPVICRTLAAFQSCEAINGIVLVTEEGKGELYRDMAHEYGITKLESVVDGADTRARSVMNGLESVGSQYGYVAIHDGVRCLVTPGEITSVIEQAYIHGAAIAACRSYDTIKIADINGFIKFTPDRDFVWRAQTPQVFKKSLLISSACLTDESVTDDSMWAELAGFNVKLVECSPHNIKLTTPDDVVIAENYFKRNDI